MYLYMHEGIQRYMSEGACMHVVAPLPDLLFHIPAMDDIVS